MKNGITMKQITNKALSKNSKKLDAFSIFEVKDTQDDGRDTLDKFYEISRKSLMGVDLNPATDMNFGDDDN